MTEQPHPEIDVIIATLAALLAPMFIVAAKGDARLAKVAAIKTVNNYLPRHQGDLIIAAQVVAFGIASLASLSLSMQADLAPNMVTRLRANANGCSRSAERNLTALRQMQDAEAMAEPPVEPPQAAPAPASKTEQDHRDALATTLTQTANEFAAEMDTLPADQRDGAAMHIDMLNTIAAALRAGNDLGPFPAR